VEKISAGRRGRGALIYPLYFFNFEFIVISMEKETKQEFEKLAGMIKRGFDVTAQKADVDDRFEQVDKRLEKIETETREGFKRVDERFMRVDERFVQVDERFMQVNFRLSNIERDTEEIRKHFIYRDEFEDLTARVKYLETKLGIESGK